MDGSNSSVQIEYLNDYLMFAMIAICFMAKHLRNE